MRKNSIKNSIDNLFKIRGYKRDIFLLSGISKILRNKIGNAGYKMYPIFIRDEFLKKKDKLLFLNSDYNKKTNLFNYKIKQAVFLGLDFSKYVKNIGVHFFSTSGFSF